MKIAVTSRGAELDSEVDPRFGRARYFVIVDTDSGEAQAVDNEQNLNAAQGAGPQAAQLVAQHGGEALLTGHVGPNAFRALSAAGIKIYSGAEGTVRDAVEQFKAGKLAQAGGADVQGRWM